MGKQFVSSKFLLEEPQQTNFIIPCNIGSKEISCDKAIVYLQNEMKFKSCGSENESKTCHCVESDRLRLFDSYH